MLKAAKLGLSGQSFLTTLNDHSFVPINAQVNLLLLKLKKWRTSLKNFNHNTL